MGGKGKKKGKKKGKGKATEGEDGEDGSGCPAGTLVYHKGSHCCKEKVDKQGKDITYDSQHCKGNNFIVCPLGGKDGSCKNLEDTGGDDDDDNDAESGKKGKSKGAVAFKKSDEGGDNDNDDD